MNKNELSRLLLTYGTFITDDEIETNEGYIRIRIIKYDYTIYYHKMVNGKIKEIKEIK